MSLIRPESLCYYCNLCHPLVKAKGSYDWVLSSTYAKIKNDVSNTTATPSIETTDVRLHTPSVGPNTPTIALFSTWGTQLPNYPTF